MAFKDELLAQLTGATSPPFLFVGAGMSIRYLDLESWDGLLRHFCTDLPKDYAYYRSSIGGDDYPALGSLIAKEFHEVWFSSDKYAESREAAAHLMRDFASPLKYEVAKHAASALPDSVDDLTHAELPALRSANIAGIITTNYDQLLEALFPQFKTFVGQNSLLFARSQGLGEIYKIHGCASNHDSIVLTKEDYAQFEARDKYLAAKLLTIFVEHPILFMGYSIGDPNIQAILSSVVDCLTPDQADQLAGRLFFLEWQKDLDEPRLEGHSIQIRGELVPVTRLRAQDFSPVYETLADIEVKLPVRTLRLLRERVYELVRSTAPTTKVQIIDIDDDTDAEAIEFVLGVGATALVASALKSYEGFRRVDLLKDVLGEDQSFDADSILTATLPRLLKGQARWAPVHKYLAAGTKELESLEASVQEVATCPADAWSRSNPYLRNVEAVNEDYGSITELVAGETTLQRRLWLIPLLAPEKWDADQLLEFLDTNRNLLTGGSASDKTNYAKLVVLYDRLKWGPAF